MYTENPATMAGFSVYKKGALPLPFQNASHRKVCIFLPIREKAFRCERISAVCHYFIGRRDGAANGRRNEQQHEYAAKEYQSFLQKLHRFYLLKSIFATVRVL